MEDHKPKISTVEIIIGIFLCIIADFGPAFTGPLIGVTETIVAVFMLPAMQWYIRRKGIPPMFDLVCQIAEIVPYLNVLPLTTIGFLGTISIDRNPKLSGTINTVVAKAGPLGDVVRAAATKNIASGAGVLDSAKDAGVGTVNQTGGSMTLQSVGDVRGTQTVGGAKVIHFPRKDRGENGDTEGEGEPKSEVSEEAFGVEKSEFEKQLEPMTELPQPDKKTEGNSVVDLRKK